ncbi:MAG: metallophosphoesterase [Kiritimatiellae bacterium]|nr:metallophosphoesterase [Kiritimatiellia bacterium]
MFCALFLLGPALAWAGLQWAFTRPLGLSRRGVSVCALAFMAATQKFAWYRLLGGDMFVPELPRWFIIATDFLYSASWMLLGFSLVLRLLERVWKGLSARRRVSAAACAALAAAFSAWGLYEGMRVPDVVSREIAFPDLPPAFDGFRIVHLSDLHASPATNRARFEEIVRRVNACAADCVCVTGDFVDGAPETRAAQLEPLRGLLAKHGVYGCMGNHEIYSQYEAWRPVFASLGVRMLDDACAAISRGDARLALGGVVEPLCGVAESRAEWPENETRRAFASAPEGAFRILLQHRPSGAARNAAQGVRLQLSGHTHGGAIFGLDRLVARFNEGFLRGLREVFAEGGSGALTLHVSPGTGQWAGFPLRMGVPAEITVLTLKRGDGRQSSSWRAVPGTSP